jgi:hypothetical protein
MEKDPSKRFQSIAELKNALKTPLNAAPLVPAGSTAPYSPHAAPFASHPLYGSSALSAARPSRRFSFVAWILLGLLLCGGAFAGTHWTEWKQKAQQLLIPPPSPSAPKPPDFALAGSAPSTPATAAPASGAAPADSAQSESTPAQTANAEPAVAESSDEKPAASAAVASPAPVAKPATKHMGGTGAAEKDSSPSDNSSENARKTTPKASGQAEQAETPFLSNRMASYVWVGRYEHEDRAQAAAKKIEDLGLPVAVMPRRGPMGEAYVVVTGPFGPDRVTSVVDWLKAQGFLGVRPINNLAPGHQNPEGRSGTRAGGPEE